MTSRYIKELGAQDSHHLLLFIFQFSVIVLFLFWVCRYLFSCVCVYPCIYACLLLCNCTSVRRYECVYVCMLYLQIPSWHCWNVALIIFLTVLESSNIFFKDVQTIPLRSTHYVVLRGDITLFSSFCRRSETALPTLTTRRPTFFYSFMPSPV